MRTWGVLCAGEALSIIKVDVVSIKRLCDVRVGSALGPCCNQYYTLVGCLCADTAERHNANLCDDPLVSRARFINSLFHLAHTAQVKVRTLHR